MSKVTKTRLSWLTYDEAMAAVERGERVRPEGMNGRWYVYVRSHGGIVQESGTGAVLPYVVSKEHRNGRWVILET